MKIKYNVLPHASSKPRSVTMDFTPYENLVGDWNGSVTGWDLSEGLSLRKDKMHPMVLDSDGSILVSSTQKEEPNTLIRNIVLEPDTEYLFSTYVRNNDVLSTTLHINDIYKDSVVNPYTQRVKGIGKTDEEGNLKIKLTMYDSVPHGIHDAWLDGFMVLATEEGDSYLREEELLDKYQYVRGKKESPNALDLLSHMFHFSPFKYYLTVDGRRIENYLKPLSEYGANEDSNIQTDLADWDEQIYNAFTHDVPLMSMLEGKKSHVTYAYPKEDQEMSKLHDSHFPRLQFFTGFGVNSMISDTEPIADLVNFAINIYIPVTKVLESVSAMMISNQLSSVMSELGWSKVRGSDYFLKNEQLYVLQGQYIQDQMIQRKKK